MVSSNQTSQYHSTLHHLIIQESKLSRKYSVHQYMSIFSKIIQENQIPSFSVGWAKQQVLTMRAVGEILQQTDSLNESDLSAGWIILIGEKSGVYIST